MRYTLLGTPPATVDVPIESFEPRKPRANWSAAEGLDLRKDVRPSVPQTSGLDKRETTPRVASTGGSRFGSQHRSHPATGLTRPPPPHRLS